DAQDDAASLSWSDSRRQSVRAGLKLGTPQGAKAKLAWWVTPSAAAQNERIRFLIFHYTAVDNATSLKLLTGQNVSAHYLISDRVDSRTRKPVVYGLVSEEKRAWHAGVSSWNGRVNLNDSSVGIEIVNPGFTEGMLGQKTWYPYHQQQINALKTLAREIIRRYGLAKRGACPIRFRYRNSWPSGHSHGRPYPLGRAQAVWLRPYPAQPRPR
ncbi:N-acetylmuramoyl-L-alanine amidase, partial [Pantoea ananatis]